VEILAILLLTMGSGFWLFSNRAVTFETAGRGCIWEGKTVREFFSNPIWTFLGVILALLAIIFSIVLYFLQRQNKEVSYQILSFTPLLSVEDEIKGRVKILFDQQPVEEVYLIILRITNAGRIPITKADFDEPIRISFGKGAKILSWEIIETIPKILPATGSVQDGKIVLDPILLNRFDAIKLNALTTGARLREVNVSARIHGVKEIQKLLFKDVRAAQREWLIVLLLNSIWLAIGLLLITTRNSVLLGSIVIGIFLFAIAISFASLRTKLRR